jgi:hypothetical protein
MTFRCVQTVAAICAAIVPVLVAFTVSCHAQRTTGQLLISSGFNPVAATSPAATARLMALPANQFLLRHKGSRPYYVYADPTSCTCVYVGSVSAMDKYRASFGALPADAVSSGGYTNPEQNMINSMDQDEAGADVFAPDD